MASVRMSVLGMTCSHCKAKVEEALRGLSGVYGVFVDLDGGSAEVDFDGERIDTEALVAAVKASGYEAQVVD
ncbi:MAG: heavy-metal-associated domain-containing protein [Gemmatimonadota bacterium]|nr:MAG: heavy-metal-associated domain-containing protein [Gemmatimonadota bacterium]